MSTSNIPTSTAFVVKINRRKLTAPASVHVDCSPHWGWTWAACALCLAFALVLTIH